MRRAFRRVSSILEARAEGGLAVSLGVFRGLGIIFFGIIVLWLGVVGWDGMAISSGEVR